MFGNSKKPKEKTKLTIHIPQLITPEPQRKAKPEASQLEEIEQAKKNGTFIDLDDDGWLDENANVEAGHTQIQKFSHPDFPSGYFKPGKGALCEFVASRFAQVISEKMHIKSPIPTVMLARKGSEYGSFSCEVPGAVSYQELYHNDKHTHMRNEATSALHGFLNAVAIDTLLGAMDRNPSNILYSTEDKTWHSIDYSRSLDHATTGTYSSGISQNKLTDKSNAYPYEVMKTIHDNQAYFMEKITRIKSVSSLEINRKTSEIVDIIPSIYYNIDKKGEYRPNFGATPQSSHSSKIVIEPSNPIDLKLFPRDLKICIRENHKNLKGIAQDFLNEVKRACPEKNAKSLESNLMGMKKTIKTILCQANDSDQVEVTTTTSNNLNDREDFIVNSLHSTLSWLGSPEKDLTSNSTLTSETTQHQDNLKIKTTISNLKNNTEIDIIHKPNFDTTTTEKSIVKHFDKNINQLYSLRGRGGR